MEIEIDGQKLSLKQLEIISKNEASVSISEKTFSTIQISRKVIDDSLAAGKPVYGVTTSVGAFKDCKVTEENISKFNKDLLRAHNFAIGNTLSNEAVRAAITLRINTSLAGYTGIHPNLVVAMQNMLEKNVLPEVRDIGSLGCADLGQMGQLGAAIIGEGYATYNGERLNAKEALEKAGLKAYEPQAKDGIVLVSSNATSVGRSAILISKAFRLFYLSFAVQGLSSAGFAASRQPWRTATKFEDGVISDLAEFALSSFDNDHWTGQNHVHDPLSFRCGLQIFGTALETLIHAGDVVRVAMNNSDDNPIIVDGETMTSGRSLPHRLAMSVQNLLLNIAHVSRNSLNRVVALGKVELSGLSRNLTSKDGQVLAFGPSVKQAADLYASIAHEAIPASLINITIADGMEDEATFLPLLIRKLERQLDLWGKLIAHEAFVARQACFLRGVTHDNLNGLAGKIFEKLENDIPPIDQDRVYASDFMLAESLLIDDKWIDEIAEKYPFDIWEKGRA